MTNEENIKLWVDALESGNHKQAVLFDDELYEVVIDGRPVDLHELNDVRKWSFEDIAHVIRDTFLDD